MQAILHIPSGSLVEFAKFRCGKQHINGSLLMFKFGEYGIFGDFIYSFEIVKFRHALTENDDPMFLINKLATSKYKFNSYEFMLINL